MPVTKSTCPECGHSFAARDGPTRACPVCDAEFAAAVPGGRDDAYKNSWQRYAVLAVLLSVMGVLGYTLYEKRMNAREAALREQVAANSPPPRGPVGDVSLTPGGTRVGGRSAADLRQNLTGTWVSKTGDETATVEYKDDGTFAYTASGATKAITGQWAVTEPQARGTGPTIEWAVEGRTFAPAPLALRGDKLEKHPLLHRPDDSGTFERK